MICFALLVDICDFDKQKEFELYGSFQRYQIDFFFLFWQNYGTYKENIILKQGFDRVTHQIGQNTTKHIFTC